MYFVKSILSPVQPLHRLRNFPQLDVAPLTPSSSLFPPAGLLEVHVHEEAQRVSFAIAHKRYGKGYGKVKGVYQRGVARGRAFLRERDAAKNRYRS